MARMPNYTDYRLKRVLSSIRAIPAELTIRAIWAIPAVLTIRAIRPIVKIQICRINSERIGHFVSDIAEQIGREKSRNPRTLRFFYFGDISNVQWEKMAKRSILKVFGPWLKYIDQWNRLIPGCEDHLMLSSNSGSRDMEGLFQKFDCSLPFTKSEVESCKSWLRSKGWNEGEPFVTLLVRDSAYLQDLNPSFDWSYHDYRDSEIETYIPAIDWLTGQGVWVLRMGKIQSRPMKTNSNMAIDYAFDLEKSDLLDIWLFANSSAIISTASGLDYLGGIYRKPILFLNALPLFDLASSFDMTWVPKNLIWKDSGEFLTLSETIEHNHYYSNEYAANGIAVEDLSTDVIEQSVIEFWQEIRLGEKYSQKDTEAQALFWDVFTKHSKFKDKHNVVHRNASVGNFWLSKMGSRYLS